MGDKDGKGKGKNGGKSGDGDKSTKPCFEWRDKGTCSHGKDCIFRHDGKAAASPRRNKSPKGSKKTPRKGKK